MTGYLVDIAVVHVVGLGVHEYKFHVLVTVAEGQVPLLLKCVQACVLCDTSNVVCTNYTTDCEHTR